MKNKFTLKYIVMGANAWRESKIFRPFTMKAGGKIYMEHILVWTNVK